MLNKVLIVKVSLFLIVTNAFSQGEVIKVFSMSDLLKKDSAFFSAIDSFLINETGIYLSEDEKSYFTIVYNVISNKNIDSENQMGLYYIGRPSSEANYALVLKNRNKNLTFIKNDDLNDLAFLFSKLNDFFLKNEINDNNVKLKYYFSVVKYLNQISNYPISSDCLKYSWNCQLCK